MGLASQPPGIVGGWGVGGLVQQALWGGGECHRSWAGYRQVGSRWVQYPHPPPVKNQARWVVQFLADMAALHVRTGDSRFSVILVDFESEDMDVERALRAAPLPR